MYQSAPIQDVKKAILPYLTEEERMSMTAFELVDEIAASNSNSQKFDFKKTNGELTRLSENDIIIVCYKSLLFKKTKTGEYDNKISGLGATNAGLLGVYDGRLTVMAGQSPVETGTPTQCLESKSNNPGTIESAPSDRFVQNVFVWQGNGTLKSEIVLGEDYGTTVSVDLTAANQIYLKKTFKGLIIRNMAYSVGTKNFATFQDFFKTLKSRGVQK